ncbi:MULTISPECIES: nuclear transport factor 2 family protein [Serratia]|uniref:nuclear transport factor 2 family protein n=1 Tax=Serratia TaxID=613 RepID=UPI00066944A8|nr:hypothetical protein [Serratia marcescens]BEN48334.1 hypothetical protein SMKC057_04460 [Serratia marcescens]HAT3674483.1 hypothetical protein [Serratia marcescens]HEJ6999625.1 hypothetical protein [Serratia marcescens]HEJ7054721.1 hypothetical protein [Serratia marcescens]
MKSKVNVYILSFIISILSSGLPRMALAENISPADVAKIVQKAHDNFTSNPQQIIDAFADNAIIEYPFAPQDIPGFPRKIKGKKAISEYFYGLTNYIKNYRYDDWEKWKSWRLEGTDNYLLEYSATGETVQGSKPYHQNLHAIVKIKNGKITYFREYWDPYSALLIFGLIKKVSPDSNK